MTDHDDDTIVSLAQQRTRTSLRPMVMTGSTPTCAQLLSESKHHGFVMRVYALPAERKTCLSCGAVVVTDADGNIPDGGMPCGH